MIDLSLSPFRRPAPVLPRRRDERPPRSPSIEEILRPLLMQVGESNFLRGDSLGLWHSRGQRFWLPRFVFQRTPKAKSRIKVAIFAGIHGDEPAGILGLLDLVRELDEDPELGRDYQLWIYPLCNPGGYVDGSRHSRAHKDLNREFWRNSQEPEIVLLERELRQQKFDGIISLHSDDTSDGMYGFIGGSMMTENLLKPALAQAEEALPINAGGVIDGFHAVEGIIRSGYGGMLSSPPGQLPAPFEIVLETPQLAPLDLQRKAFVLALVSILSEYRRLISFAANI